MKKGPLRIVAVLLLAFTLLTLSGVASTAATLFDAQATQGSCCDADTDGEVPTGKVPCSTPDCSCFSCINFLIPVPPSLPATSLVQTSFHLSVQRSHICDFVRSIDYPPENA